MQKGSREKGSGNSGAEAEYSGDPDLWLDPDHRRLYSVSYFMNMGVIHWNGWKWTWYSERVLPGGGLNIPGRHADSDGYICDSNDYICLSSSSLSKGTIIATPFGKSGKVYDTGCASDVIDVYVSW